MSSKIFFIFLIAAFCAGIFPAKAIEVFVTNSVFHAPEIGTYVETDIFITSTSIQFAKQASGKQKGSVEVSLVYKQGEQIITFDKYLLHSVETDDTNSFANSLIDKKRFALAPGSYTLEASFRDMNKENNSTKKNRAVFIAFDATKVELSDIAMIDTFYASTEENLYTRNGYYMVPQVLNYFPDGINKLTFYAEVYNTDKLNDETAVIVTVKKFKENTVVGNLSYSRKIPASAVNVVFSEFDISGLYTGNYNLTMEMRNRKNELLALKQLFFQRSKEIEATPESLAKLFVENTFVEAMTTESSEYHLKSILPLTDVNESKKIHSLLKDGTLLDKQRYFLLFWMNRNASDPAAAWQEYSKEIKMVNDNYGTTIYYGFQTDRGRVRLQYGAPTDILNSQREPGALPYEIWTYNQIANGQTNVKFVFFNQDLVTNTYELIHSTANGEIRNDQWQRIIYASFMGGESPLEMENPEVRPHYGSKATDYYKKE